MHIVDFKAQIDRLSREQGALDGAKAFRQNQDVSDMLNEHDAYGEGFWQGYRRAKIEDAKAHYEVRQAALRD